MSEVLRISVPLTVWLASFSAIYGLHGLACSGEWAPLGVLGFSGGRLALVMAWIFAIGLQLGIFLAVRSDQFGSRSKFIRRTSIVLSCAALVATLWTLLPVAAASTCL